MSIEIIKKAALGAAGAIALLSAGAHAQVSPTNNAGQWDVVSYQTGGSTYSTGSSATNRSFTGTSELSASVVSADCGITLTGDVEIQGSGDLTIDVTSGSISGSGTCSRLRFAPSSFPWNVTVPGAASQSDADALDDVLGTVTGIAVQFDLFGVGAYTTICSGSLPAVFSNGATDVTDPSSFTFNDNIGTSGCAVDGTIFSPTNQDTNAW